jgi:hypothetical protein
MPAAPSPLLARITIDPDVRFGKPCIRGHRARLHSGLDRPRFSGSVEAVSKRESRYPLCLRLSNRDRGFWKLYYARLILAVSVISLPLLGHAEENCLWLNAATAGGVLGGIATMSVSRVSAKPSNTRAANAISGSGPTSADPSAAKYSGNGIDDEDCVFVRQSGPITGELHIDVRTMSEPAKEFMAFTARCGTNGTPLKAIGNEATACSMNDKSGRLVEQVVGRVRDRAFVIRLSIKDPVITQDAIREKARKVADQVAGNLF